MSDRNRQKQLNLGANLTDTEDSVAIPNEKRLMIRKIGIACQSLSDNSGVSISVRFGIVGQFQDVRSFFTSGNTIEIPINKELTGDGLKFFRVIVKNYSAVSARDVSWWIEAYDF